MSSNILNETLYIMDFLNDCENALNGLEYYYNLCSLTDEDKALVESMIHILKTKIMKVKNPICPEYITDTVKLKKIKKDVKKYGRYDSMNFVNGKSKSNAPEE